MKNIVSKIILSAIMAIALSFTAAMPVLAQDDSQDTGTYEFNEQSGLNKAATVAGYETGANATPIETVISTIVYLILGFVGLIFFALVIMGAFTWMTAEGNEEKVKKANGMVMQALIGLIITLSAYALSYFLISYFW